MSDTPPLIDIRPDHWIIVRDILRKHVPQYMVWAFGSRARGTAKPFSDLDLVILTDQPLPLEVSAALAEDFSESDLPYKVDLVDWATTAKSFRQIIERDKVVVQEEERSLDVMNGWMRIPFAQVLTGPVRNGVYKSKGFHGRGAKIVNMGELFGHPRIRSIEMKRVELTDSETERFSLAEGDLIFARRSLTAEGAGKCSVILELDEPTTFESSIIRARPDQQKTDSLFLYYFFNSPLGFHALGTIRRQVAVAGITGKDLATLEIPIPPLPEQRAIADVLGTLDDKIELNRKQNKTLEAMAQALFKSWFVDFDPVRAKMEGREPEGMDAETAALFPDDFEESELGLVPRGWRVGELGNLFALRNERTKPSEATLALPYIPIESITSKSPFLQGCKSGNEANSSLILFKKGDVLFGAMRPYFHKVCMAPFDGITRTTVFTLTPKNLHAKAFALFQAYQESTVEYATQHSEGSTIPFAKWYNSLEKMPIVFPPEDIQAIFSNVVLTFIERANENLLQIELLARLRDTLLPRLISGQLRLPEAEAAMEAVQG